LRTVEKKIFCSGRIEKVVGSVAHPISTADT